jgi:hypothetical protein
LFWLGSTVLAARTDSTIIKKRKFTHFFVNLTTVEKFAKFNLTGHLETFKLNDVCYQEKIVMRESFVDLQGDP